MKEDKTAQKYFNFPIQLLEGFMVDTNICLNNIFDYALVNYSKNINKATDIKRLECACNDYRVKSGNIKKTLRNGNTLIDLLPTYSPMTGISTGVWFDFYKEYKSDFEKVCLLAFLSMKSIIGNKPYCKMTNNYFLARMDGKTKAIQDLNELSPGIRKYSNEYQTKKIRLELSANWGMAFYAKATKGFYASSKLDINELTFQVLKTKQTDKYQKVKEAAKNAELKAKSRLGIASP